MRGVGIEENMTFTITVPENFILESYTGTNRIRVDVQWIIMLTGTEILTIADFVIRHEAGNPSQRFLIRIKNVTITVSHLL